MPLQKRPPCQVCCANESKYTCAKCMVLYCSIPCFKSHKENSCRPDASANATSDQAPQRTLLEAGATDDVPTASTSTPPTPPPPPADPRPITPPPALRPLTALNWPYVPEESAFPDPLKRDDPKMLQLHQYEAIATSPSIRRILAAHPQLKPLLRNIDALRGPSREDALQRALGVSSSPSSAPPSFAPGSARVDASLAQLGVQSDEDTRVLRELAEAVEAAVRGGREGALGLDWGDEP